MKLEYFIEIILDPNVTVFYTENGISKILGKDPICKNQDKITWDLSAGFGSYFYVNLLADGSVTYSSDQSQ